MALATSGDMSRHVARLLLSARSPISVGNELNVDLSAIGNEAKVVAARGLDVFADAGRELIAADELYGLELADR
jgi:hypothetical protein